MGWSYMHLIKSPIIRDKRKWVYKVITEETMSDNLSGIMKDTVHRYIRFKKSKENNF